MPERARSHQLEDESRQAFESLLTPAGFVFRREVDEYGVDGAVEEFTGAGLPTGVRFFVQLKATDEENLDAALACDLKTDTVDYLRSLSLPTLLVRYVAASRALYGRWLHQADLKGSESRQRSTRFRWETTDALDEASPSALAREAEAFLQLRSPSLSFPLSLYLDVPQDGSLGFSQPLLVSGLRAATGNPDALFNVEPGEAPAGGLVVTVREGHLGADLGGVAAEQLSLGRYVPETPSQFGADAMVTLALAFEKIGRTDVAARLASTWLPTSHLRTSLEAAWGLAAVSRRTRRPVDALRLADDLDASVDADAQAASLPFIIAAKWHGRNFTAEEAQLFADVMRRRVARRVERGELAAAGQESYNLANLQRSRREPSGAIVAFDEALALTPRYSDLAYFHFERAGALFLAGRYAESADEYEVAVSLGGDPAAVTLRADALLFAGRFAEAREVLAGRDPDSDEPGSEWRLKERWLELLVGRFGEEQERAADDADKMLTELDFARMGVEQIGDALNAVLGQDALSALAWFNLGRARLDKGEPDGAMWAYVGAALALFSWDSEAWTNVVVLGMGTQAVEIAAEAIAVGAARIGEAFRQDLIVAVSKQRLGPSDEREFLRLIDQIFDEVARHSSRRGMLIREHLSDGTVATYVLDDE